MSMPERAPLADTALPEKLISVIIISFFVNNIILLIMSIPEGGPLADRALPEGLIIVIIISILLIT